MQIDHAATDVSRPGGGDRSTSAPEERYLPSVPAAWPSLDYEDWSATCDTLHAHTQVLGKLAVALAPPEPSCSTRRCG